MFLTGLSGSGKTTIANVLVDRLRDAGRTVVLLDGDVVRRNLWPDLGFSRDDRDTNVRRIGSIASEIAAHGGVALCSMVAPYDAARKDVRRMVEQVGGFVLVHVATPLDVCETRDPKGLYAKARAGLLPAFTGVSDPYEVPDDAELVVDTTRAAPEAASSILSYLTEHRYIGSSSQ